MIFFDLVQIVTLLCGWLKVANNVISTLNVYNKVAAIVLERYKT
jgi:hypothetical protein